MDEFEISWEELKGQKDAIGLEWASIGLYAEKYKELPPLNLQLRRTMFMVWGLSKWGESRWAHTPDEFVRSIVDS